MKTKKTKVEKKTATASDKKRKAKALPRGVIASMNSAMTKLNKVSKFINDESKEA